MKIKWIFFFEKKDHNNDGNVALIASVQLLMMIVVSASIIVFDRKQKIFRTKSRHVHKRQSILIIVLFMCHPVLDNFVLFVHYYYPFAVVWFWFYEHRHFVITLDVQHEKRLFVVPTIYYMSCFASHFDSYPILKSMIFRRKIQKSQIK